MRNGAWWVGVLVLVAAARAPEARAEDPRKPFMQVVADEERAAVDAANALDAVFVKGELDAWTAARERYLAQIEARRKALEDMTLAFVLSAKGDPHDPALAQVMDLAKRLGYGALTYRVLTERAVKLDPAARKGEFQSLEKGLASRALWRGIEGTRQGRRRGGMPESADNLRSLVMLYVGAEAGLSKPWPSFSGKRLVLWLVATGQMDRQDVGALGLLFSPGDSKRSVAKAGGPTAFEGITLAKLQDAKVDLDKFTSYAGRANTDKEHLLSAAELEKGAAILADLSFPNAAIVAFTSGNVKIMTRADLGLAPADPIVVGPTSKSEVLRHLSDK